MLLANIQIDSMLFNEECHEQALSRAVIVRAPHSIYKDAYMYNARVQPIRRFWPIGFASKPLRSEFIA